MKYEIELQNPHREVTQTIRVNGDAGQARIAFLNKTASVAHCALIAISETGQRMTMVRH